MILGKSRYPYHIFIGDKCIEVTYCEQWYIIFCIFVNFLNKLELET